MKLICKLQGHAFPRDSQWGKPYLRINSTAIDGMGHIHAYLEGQCERCGEFYHVANIHLPKPARS